MSNLARWTEIFREMGLHGDPIVHAELRRRHSEPSRVFHTLHRVAECLDLFEQVRDLCDQPAEVELAIWFHDALYDVRRADNELRSADWARTVLQVAGASDTVIDAVCGLIIATAAQAEPVTEDEALMIDIDLSILGARPARYAEYERQLRRESRHVPQQLYQSVRKKALRDYLARPRIYFTDWFKLRYETQARANLQRSLRQLSGGGLLQGAM
ncbi:N-methyl-D-aspartate receptor NMDAR2C subunit [Sinimarinibacterium sp. CAU 1509]|uniref:HD domain-containing protein n=1 Tax=Sinimarinibacterium sp. CAU 1509 TaxID=2562283 RepID=UPI0010ABA925|nr:N-methyl-D-aspartate receptor NMDAR2C subunit [Sinimarinibacterium sp. CAU 1509]TJY60800.1 N-methyl-D-aspartate receptor NMDAR2C subunit [Sinimarinibacterium sp. CAU 1509]